MRLERGETIELEEEMLEEINYELAPISTITTSKEAIVYDLTTSTGFFTDSRGIHHKQCGSHSVEYIKKLGLNLNTVLSKSKPAKTASVLVNHLLTFSATIQNQFAGAVGYDAVNIFFAPFFVGKSYRHMKQVAQELFFGFSQSAFSRGGQSLFSDLNFYLTVPAHYAKAKVIGPGGKYVKLIKYSDGALEEYKLVECSKEEASIYKELEPWAQQFCKAVLEVMEEGDSTGMPFAFPKGNFHVDDATFEPRNQWLFDALTKTTSQNGSPYFIFDRGNTRKITQCCRLQKTFGEDDFKTAEESPELIRFQAIQNITLNLPRVGYRYQSARAEGEALDPFEFSKVELDRLLGLCIRAHKAKKKYIKRLMGLPGSPLHLLKYGMDGNGYMDLEKALFLVGIIGLNEMVQCLCGKELHESEEAYNLGMQIIAYISLRVQKLGEAEGLSMVVEESPAESTSKRLAKLDHYYFNGEAERYTRGNKETGAIYYTNSIHIREDSGVGFIDRIKMQSRFHPMISGGAIIHLWVGENLPSPESIKTLIEKTHRGTNAQQITISPEFTLCEECLHRMMGLQNKCEKCGNDNSKLLTQITRVVGYFSKVSNWTDSKQEELTTREHHCDFEKGS